jgi:chromosome segregation ATPase
LVSGWSRLRPLKRKGDVRDFQFSFRCPDQLEVAFIDFRLTFAGGMTMSDFERLEQQISQLIGMVAKNNEVVFEVRSELRELKSEVAQLKTDVEQLKADVAQLRKEFNEEKELNRSRYVELLKEIRYQNYLFNYYREKIAKNEEDISVIKQKIEVLT